MEIDAGQTTDTRFFARPEGFLAYDDLGGDGDLVVMLPGMGALRSEYRYLVPALVEAGFRAVAVDLRGQGESSVPWPAYDVPSVGNDILALIHHLNAGPAHVIATSFGPAAAVWAAAQSPHDVRSLVLIAPFVRKVKISPVMRAAFWAMTHNPWRARAWVAYYKTLYPTRRPPDFDDYLADLLANLREPGRYGAARALGASSRKPSEERLGKVRVPTLVVMGTKDPDFADPAAEAAVVAEATGGNVALVDGAGHYPQAEMPLQTTPVVLDFLRGVRRPARPASPVAKSAPVV